MSLREFAPFFQWGFSFRRSRFLVPLINNDVFVCGSEAVSAQMVVDPAAPALKRSGSAKVPLDELLSLPSASVPTVSATRASLPTAATAAARPLDSSCPAALPTVSAAAFAVPPAERPDAELVADVLAGRLPMHSLERVLGDHTRAVRVRRVVVAAQLRGGSLPADIMASMLSLEPTAAGRPSAAVSPLDPLPHEHFDYSLVAGANIENPIGYVQIPVGVAGPLLLDGVTYQVPMATTEGCLVASTARGAKAVTESGGAHAVVIDDGMTRAPCLRFPSMARAAEFVAWCAVPGNLARLQDRFATTSRFARLTSVKCSMAGRMVFARFKAVTGDAMGMNGVGKGTEACLDMLRDVFSDMEVIALSGNVCSDKKPAAVNWVLGRGKSVVAEAVISGDVVQRVLKSTVPRLVDLAVSKNLVGSAMAGAVGGFNAHAANIVAAIFIATGQDPAQVGESSNCITLLEPANDGRDLRISVSMPSIELGTVGGGTGLPAQSACLAMLGVKGSASTPGANAQTLARIVAASVLCGELSLLSALAGGSLIESHMRLNRSSAALANASAPTLPLPAGRL